MYTSCFTSYRRLKTLSLLRKIGNNSKASKLGGTVSGLASRNWFGNSGQNFVRPDKKFFWSWFFKFFFAKYFDKNCSSLRKLGTEMEIKQSLSNSVMWIFCRIKISSGSPMALNNNPSHPVYFWELYWNKN